MKSIIGTGGLVGGVSMSLLAWACSSPQEELLTEGHGAGRANVPLDPEEQCGGGQGGTSTVTTTSGGTGLVASFSVGELREAERRPPALSGGTLLATADGKLLVGADPERDRVYFVDVSDQYDPKLLGEVVLPEGAEPGRLVEDDAGRVHVALRGTGDVVSIDIEAMQIVDTRPVCAQPRGIAHDPQKDVLHVACAEGLLMTLPTSGGSVNRVLNLGDDLRDVIVRGDELYVSRFRSAELVQVSADNEITATLKPRALAGPPIVGRCGVAAAAPAAEVPHREFEAQVAWRTIPLGTYQALMVHQREEISDLLIDEETDQGYSGAPLECLGVVQSVVSVLSAYGEPVAFPTLAGAVLPVDIALSSEKTHFAVVAAGANPEFPGNVFFQDLETHVEAAIRTEVISSDSQACPVSPFSRQVEGSPTSVVFLPDDRAAVLTRQPARVYLFDATLQGEPLTVELSDIDTTDTGYKLFHSDVGGGIACASCHPEARDDGHVWSFEGVGPRRTQSIRGGILGTEPFHWEGDMEHFGELVAEVMEGRMNGPRLGAEYIDSLAHWIDAQPALERSRFDEEASARGEALFHSNETGCGTCHTGPMFTNDLTVDVGTGLPLQVPSLLGVSFRAPYMHDGCAPNLNARFGACGGGDLHGRTSQLTDGDVADLVAYMKTL